jgi:hypothetical protein
LETFSPSGLVDLIWHAHLSFLDHYYHDVQALTGSTEIIKHSPAFGKEALGQYPAAHKVHVTRMNPLNKSVYAEFWPSPQCCSAHFEEEKDGDLGDHMYLPSTAGCG